MISEKITVLSLPYTEGGEKTVRVYAPEHEEGESLPVIYMTDGQNLFEDDNVEFGCWYTREAVRDERKKSGRAAIIVGIHNDEGGPVRAGQLTPVAIGEIQAPEPLKSAVRPCGEVFADYVVNTVMPRIEADFPVKTGRDNTAFCGSSSGGLECFYIVMTYPDKFCAGGVFSPCFMLYLPDDLEKWIRGSIRDEKPFLYLYSGGEEGIEKAICLSTEMAYGILSGCYPVEKLKKVIRPEQPHKESAWAAEFRVFLHNFLDNS